MDVPKRKADVVIIGAGISGECLPYDSSSDESRDFPPFEIFWVKLVGEGWGVVLTTGHRLTTPAKSQT